MAVGLIPEMTMNVVQISRALNVVAAVLTVAPMIMASDLRYAFSEPPGQVILSLVSVSVFAAIAVGPFVLSHFGARTNQDWKGGWIFPAATLIAIGVALTIYVDAFFFSKPDGQVGLIFLIIPFYQFAFVGALWVVAAILKPRMTQT
jgi:hypothetical protein